MTNNPQVAKLWFLLKCHVDVLLPETTLWRHIDEESFTNQYRHRKDVSYRLCPLYHG